MAGRLRSFSDGVFSIVLTLLVLNLSIPAANAKIHSDAELTNLLLSLLPKFAGYLLSFVLAGVFWILHAGIDRAVAGADRPVLAANLVSLFPITVLPFTTDLTTRALASPLAWALYAGDMALAAIGTVVLWAVVVRRGFVDPTARDERFAGVPLRSGILAAVFLLSIPATYVHPIAGRYVPVLMPLAFRLLRRRVSIEKPVETPAV